jgi:transposase
MMGERQVDQGALFYEFSLERHVPAGHMLRSIDRFVDLGEMRSHLAPFYSSTGRPSVDPELLIRMLIVGYCYGIRTERRLCEEVHLNLACRWFCRLGLEGEVPDHSTFSKSRHERFRDSDLLRHVFETVVRRCIAEGLVGGDGFAVDASLIKADASRQKGVEGAQGLAPDMSSRAIDEYLAVLDDAAFGAATEVTPKFIWPADPAARWTRAHGGQAFFAYSNNYLIDLDHAVIVDVEASTAARQAEVTAATTMIERTGKSASTSTRSGWLATRPMARPRCSAGWSTTAGSSPTCPCSTSRSGATAPSPATTSPTTMRATSTSARAAC